ncbi:MAG: hypothetical protein KF716_08720 [Anaerolineae bacterium]|nr:hypothetical protein [Anaerolineae bacterium]
MELLHTLIGEFRGKRHPDIPLPFDRSELPEDAFFSVLPIGKVGAESRNKRTYSRKAIESIVEHVNHDHPYGWWGHPEHEARVVAAPAIQWLGAVLDDDGVAWGKCVALNSEARELLRMATLTRSQIGTSVYGVAEMDGEIVVDIELMYIDLLTLGEWVGVPITSTVPILTAESNQQGETNMPDATELAIQVATITQERDTAKQALAAAQQTIAEMEALRPAAEQVEAIRKAITESADVYTRLEINISGYGSDLKQVVMDTIEKLKGLLDNQLTTEIDKAVDAQVNVIELRPVVREMLKDVKKTADIQPRIVTVLAMPHIQAIAAKLVAQEAGPSAVGSGATPVSTNQQVIEDAVAKARENAKKMGLLSTR